jgi:hypothetical protein
VVQEKVDCNSLLFLPAYHPKTREFRVTEERKFAILFAATILAARKLIDMDPNKPNMAKGYFVDRAIDDASFILERIDRKWPTQESNVPPY